MKNARRIIISFLCGQCVDFFLFLVAFKLNVANIFAWTTASGMLITLAVVTGVAIAFREVHEAVNKSSSARKPMTGGAVNDRK